MTSEFLAHETGRHGLPGRRLVRRLMTAAVLVTAAAGCGRAPGIIFDTSSAQSLVWPPAPERARIHYLGQIVTEEDLKPGRTFGRGVSETLFGKEPVRSMLTPYAVCTDGGDRIFIADSNAQAVHVFNLATRRYEQWRPPAEGRGFSQPVGIAFDPYQRLLVSDSVAAAIFVFDGDGSFLGDFGAGQLARPCGLAVDPVSSRIFVADAAEHQIVVLAMDGEVIERIGERGTEPGQFNFPTNVAIDHGGRLYVSDSLNFRVQVFDRDLRSVMQIGGKGDLPGSFSQPKGIALDSEDHLYVVDANFEAVQVFDPQGRLLLTFGEEGSGPGQFWLPAGICIDVNDRIWVADPYNRRVQVFEYRPEVKP